MGGLYLPIRDLWSSGLLRGE